MKKRILAILMAAIMCCLQLAEFVPAEKVKAAYSVSEEDIYYRCPEYLDNKAYDNYMARCEERIEKGMSTINDAEGLGASILFVTKWCGHHHIGIGKQGGNWTEHQRQIE